MGLALLPYKQMFLWQIGNHIFDGPSIDFEPQLQPIFVEGDKLFYVDERSDHSRNEALLVANTIINLAELDIGNPSFVAEYGMRTEPTISKDDLPLEFEKNLEMAMQVASDVVLAGHLPVTSKFGGEVERFIRDSISN